jgi:hypothetical protein
MTDEEGRMLLNKLVERGNEIKRLREALQNIAIGGIGETNWSTEEMRAYAEDALKP